MHLGNSSEWETLAQYRTTKKCVGMFQNHLQSSESKKLPKKNFSPTYEVTQNSNCEEHQILNPPKEYCTLKRSKL